MSKKWQNKWNIPGGHVDAGETILEGAIREGKEETGLDLKAITILRHGEIINSSSYHRKAHFIYFACLLETKNGNEVFLNDELTKHKWVTPEEGLKMDCAPKIHSLIKEYINYLHK